MRLLEIQRGGTLPDDVPALPWEADGVLAATARLYEVAGFEPPWICYVAVTNGLSVGTCGFKSLPQDGRVEIAYFTFPGFEGKGIATQMARQLIALATAADRGVTIAAQTLPGRNASHRVLEKLGFTCVGSVEHPEDGVVLEWQRADRPAPRTHDASGGWNAVALDFIRRRSPVIGVSVVLNWAKAIPPGGSILDLGCGHGFPIATALVKSGFSVFGVDASERLVQEFRARLPGAQVRCEPVEVSTFFDRQFDAAIAIGLMFLLDEQSQRRLLRRVSDAVRPGGMLLFNAPTQAVSWTDMLTGRQSWSMGKEAYEALLEECGFELTGGYTDEGESYYYGARKLAQHGA